MNAIGPNGMLRSGCDSPANSGVQTLEEPGDFSEVYPRFAISILLPTLGRGVRQCPGATADIKLDPEFHNGAQ
jgi:hypothetical protein